MTLNRIQAENRSDLAERLRAEALMHYQITQLSDDRARDLLAHDARWQAAELLESMDARAA